MRVLSAIMFFPRGGSAHVARALTLGLRERGVEVTLLSGSSSGHGDARRFYGDVIPVDFEPALASAAPLRFTGPPGTAPMHPSYEDRPGAPDGVFAALDDLDYERQVRAWARELARAGAATADVALLHHLTPVHEALARVAPGVPIVTQLHGTELLMLERIAAGAPTGWAHAQRWAARLQAWAQRSARLLVPPSGRERAVRLLGVAPERLVPLVSGVDGERFAPRAVAREQVWRRVLSDAPRGWRPGGGPGSVRYPPERAEALARSVVLLSVGRFTAVKRLDRLISAFAAARTRARTPSALVLVGGHPGEWEGTHPAELAERPGVDGVYLAGWYEHEELPELLSAADGLALSSEHEQFGLVLVEAMACGLPVVATRSPGPELIVADGETGWLVPADAEAALVRALVELIDEPDERRRRGTAARRRALTRFSWPGVSATVADVLAEAAAGTPQAPAARA